ncbi:MAG: hypothetical protein IPP94_09185 [Ignavibacteria bacterium]|nr:hypothetical protein [Ignavibacteria bacterium]
MNGDILVAPMINQNLLTVSEITLVYTTDNWATSQTMPMTVNTSAKRFSGNFPAQKAGSIVRYYYDCKDNYGSTFRVPTLAPMQNYLFLVGFISRAFYDSELADGWTVEADCETGKWVRAKPVGTWNTSLGSPPDVPYVQPNADKTPGLNKDRCGHRQRVDRRRSRDE